MNHRRGCGAARIRGVLGGREGAAASPSSVKAGSVGGPPGEGRTAARGDGRSAMWGTWARLRREGTTAARGDPAHGGGW